MGHSFIMMKFAPKTTLRLDFVAVGVAACGRLCLAGRWLVIFVKVVAFEELLGGRIFKMDLIFFDSLSIFPFLVVYVILVKILVIWVG